MTDKARELLERALIDWDSYEEPYFERLHFAFDEIRAYLAQPEVKLEALNEETIRWEYEKTEKNLRTVALTEYGWFDAGVRFAEKHHGIGGGDE